MSSQSPRCFYCGALLSAEEDQCPRCQRPATHTAVQQAALKPANARPLPLSILAVFDLVVGLASLAISFVLLDTVLQSWAPTEGPFLVFLGGCIFFVVLGAVAIISGLRLWRLRFGRGLQITLSLLGLFLVPLGTVFSIAILVYLFKPGVKLLFSGRPPTSWSLTEAQSVASLRGGSAIVWSVSMVMALFAFMASLGFIANIVIPSLTSARIAANEAQAIHDLRVILQAEFAYAELNGNHYDSPECLTHPSECLTDYPADGDLFVERTMMGSEKGYERGFYAGPSASEAARAEFSPTSLDSFAVGFLPSSPGYSGIRSFCGTSEGLVCAVSDGAQPVGIDGTCIESCEPLE